MATALFPRPTLPRALATEANRAGQAIAYHEAILAAAFPHTPLPEAIDTCRAAREAIEALTDRLDQLTARYGRNAVTDALTTP